MWKKPGKLRAVEPLQPRISPAPESETGFVTLRAKRQIFSGGKGAGCKGVAAWGSLGEAGFRDEALLSLASFPLPVKLELKKSPNPSI